jgi:hypothetical protein
VLREVDVRKELAASKDVPSGRCTRCCNSTGKEAPHYARLEVEEVVMWLPFCEECIVKYFEMIEDQRPKEAAKVAKKGASRL